MTLNDLLLLAYIKEFHAYSLLILANWYYKSQTIVVYFLSSKEKMVLKCRSYRI